MNLTRYSKHGILTWGIHAPPGYLESIWDTIVDGAVWSVYITTSGELQQWM